MAYMNPMKKYIIIPIGICLICISLVGYYLYTNYIASLDVKKELLMNYVSTTKNRMGMMDANINELSCIVLPLFAGNGLLSEDPESHTDVILQLGKFYDANKYFIRNISVYDHQGNVFTVSKDEEGRFLKDRYKSRSVNALRSERETVVDKNNYLFIVPVYSGGTLAGNVAISLDLGSFQNELFGQYVGKGIWPTMILDHANYATFPPEDGLLLTQAKTIAGGMEKDGSGFLEGRIMDADFSTKVISYYEIVPVSGHLFGIVFSCGISSLFSSSFLVFLVASLVFFLLTAAIIVFFSRISTAYRKEIKAKDERINFVQTIYQNVSVGIIISQQHRLFAANPCALKLLDGFVSLKDIGKDMDKIPFPVSFYETSDQETFQEWQLCTYERDGQALCLCKRQTKIDIDGTRYTIETFWDITDMEQSRKAAIRSEIAKSELLSRISTDFKKPLDGIKDAVTLLAQKHTQDANIEHISYDTKILSDMLDNVQDFADIEAGRIIPDEMPFNIVDEIRKVTDAYSVKAKPKGITIQAHIASSVIRKVVGDPQRFKQVLEQLLNNAIKFTSEGEIRISLETVQLQEGKVLVKCSVEDTGKGMTKKQLRNLFSIDLRAKEDRDSIGLGTIIAKKLVTIMGGTIRVTSPSPISMRAEAPGTQFLFTIQCYSDSYVPKQLDFSSITSYNQLKVLIVTSDAHNVQYLKNYLHRKEISTDIFVHNKEMEILLINKLIIDEGRYHMVIIETSDSQTSFSIATKIHDKGLTRQYMYVLIDTYNQKGNYRKARNLQIDYYFKKSEDLSNFDLILKDRFPNIKADLKSSTENESLRTDLRILISENNILSQAVAKLVFKQLGYKVDFAKNALELISQMNSNTYDIIFIDLKFPPTDGFDITTMLRQKGYKLPIIAMTSTLTKDNLKSISNSGMNGYVQKPLNKANVGNILLKWFI